MSTILTGRRGTAAAPADRPPRRRFPSAWWAVAGWTVLVGGSLVAGRVLRHLGLLRIGQAAPFHGSYRLLALTLLPAVAYATLAVLVLPRLTRTLRWPPLLLLAAAGSAGWAVVLAASAGPGALAAPLTASGEYLGTAAHLGPDPATWLPAFTAHVSSLPTHVAGHPPLPLLLFWALHRAGLGGAGWAAALCVGLGSSAAAAVLVTLRRTVGEEAARGVAPYLVLAPYALTVATSADAAFLGIGAWGVALLAVALDAGSRGRTLGAGLGAGVLLGAVPYLSYGLLPLGAAALAVLVLLRRRLGRRRDRGRATAGLLAVALGAAVVVVAFTAAGFWWPDGVAATHTRWYAGVGAHRPYAYTLVANLGLLAVLTGPATAVALTRLRGVRAWLLPGAALLAVAALDASGVTRLEVERIWLPFAPWAMLAVMSLRGHRTRTWLAVQAAVALAVQGLVALAW